MKESKVKIESEKQNRNLSEERISELTNYKITFDERYPRCQSEKFQKITDTRLETGTYSAYEVYIHSKKCRVCGFNPFKNKPLNFKMRMNQWLGKYSWRSFK